MAKFGFDWGGSLENNSYLRQLARDLNAAGHEVHIIPAAGHLPSDDTYAQWLAALQIPWYGFHRVLVLDGMTPEQVAAGKVEVMQRIGCHILYDDNPHNLAAVRVAGLEAVEIKEDHPVPQPLELKGA